ncbi:fumarylacetoacetate hydrolase family protein [Lentilactobacillus sp. SPB1-3]|uniref:Fumarylacetoacetate hydrolase family protein n=1 Tax=Lentilactobacillus terminaliae TaxID=3003483 RepID=A0ACD5DF27_9LACO|nr:fumarylacetoacetate hydrolase family protein [Lentilactobacillus sp. SPB1-3]MCZ0976539.1 fumarylacetoacetate hydrolase family protein [Lentilactobacillus sp. SPB1-3]
MRIGMYEGKPVLITVHNDQLWGTNLETYKDLDEILANWVDFQETFLVNLTDADVLNNDNARLLAPEKLEQPIKNSRQLPAIGFNYRDHLKEMDTSLPKQPNVFNKFVSSLAGPNNQITINSDTVDWESELVVVIGSGGRNIPRENVEDAIAGFMVGQDLSDRELQKINGANTQFTLAKSGENYSPVGPYITTIGSISDLESQRITTKVNDRVMQDAPIGQMIFDFQTLVSYISSTIELYPGDLIFTGTPSGTGVGRDPQIFLHPGDVVESSIETLGSITTKVN